MEFKDYLKKNSKRLDKKVQKILEEYIIKVEKIEKKLVTPIKVFIKANKGGKGIRGVLVGLGYEIASPASGEGRSDVIKIGAAYEIFHTSILIHDDIMDKSPQRRGRPSVYKIVGPSCAITLGDLGFFIAVKMISESEFPEGNKNRALTFFSKVVMDTALGQILDLEGANPILTAKLKTAKYTIAGPMQLGAILAGANQGILKKIGKIGEALGIAYQIQDDVLDSGLLEKDKADALKYISLAKKDIASLHLDSKLQKMLLQMTDYIISRKR